MIQRVWFLEKIYCQICHFIVHENNKNVELKEMTFWKLEMKLKNVCAYDDVS